MIILLWLKLVFIKRILYNFKKLKNMKLRNLLYATMIACAFASCSKDEATDPDNGGNGNTNGKTMLQVNPNVIETKATAAGNTFRVYVINASGNIVADGPAKEAFELTSSDAEGNVEILVLKNMPESMGTPTSKSDLLKSISFTKNEEYDDLNNSQNTAIYKVSVVRGQLNKLGYENIPTLGVNYLDATGEPIPAFRNTAHIHLNTIRIENNVITGGSVKYTNPSLKIEEIFVLNARKSSFMAVDDTKRWAKTENKDNKYLIGVTNKEFQDWITDAKDKSYIKYSEGNTYETYVSSDWETNLNPMFGYRRKQYIVNGSTGEDVVINTKSESNSHYNPEFAGSFYVYENTDQTNPTLLVVKGEFSFDVAAGTKEEPNKVRREVMSNRYYTVLVGQNFTAGELFTSDLMKKFGITSVNEIEGVRRNIRYNTVLTVKGPGSKNPLYPGEDEDTKIDVNVELVDYGTVDQNPSID